MLVDDQIIEGAIADGPFTSEDLCISAERHYVSIVFYTSSAMTVVANPTAGTVDIDPSETGEQYGNVSTINANTAGESSSYDRPLLSGSILKVRASLANVVGATHFRLRIAGFDNE